MPTLDRRQIACIDAFQHAANQIQANTNTVTAVQVEDFMTDVRGMVTNGCAPINYFNFIAIGAYKECYHSGLDGWVIKFCTDDNPTGAEHQILQAAERAGLAQLFLRTHFISLPAPIPGTELESGYDDSYECQRVYDSCPDGITACEDCPNFKEIEIPRYQLLDYAQLQPYAHTVDYLYYDTRHGMSAESYTVDPVMIDGLPLAHETYFALGAQSVQWVQDVINYHGSKVFWALTEFVKKFDVRDLHAKNLGYYNGVPVIFDWFSNDIW